ncbi:multidrug resistance-associated protein 1-like [Macrosteles quadrilineatus]|uniref:multidrug resistance-associated protein 1-like n=1 Tax=Macrosteles quadrilineatus TaxID=74068 RepID=UPI0023E245C1|nr:multidrug resistance-associated protein 1-like [Macrosteles quadrilineatus]
MLLMIPLNSWLVRQARKLRVQQMKYKDERIKIMNEVLSSIKVLKLYAWEESFEEKITKIRQNEIKVLKTAAIFNSMIHFCYTITPYFVAVSSFTCFVLHDEHNILDAQTAFVSLALFYILRLPLNMFSQMLNHLATASVALKRIDKFLSSEELDATSVTHDPTEHDEVVIENGTFSWDGSDVNEIIIRDIYLRVPPGMLVAVVGSVGSGKSSLLSAVLGEMNKISGRVNTKGKIAYVPQQAWIQNMSLRANITGQLEFDRAAYRRVVKACALQHDIHMLPAGDLTEIGEKGINLSGGQKQRVSLARAVYSKADLYLLDDPLSAVDSHVGKHIFENVIGPGGVLSKTTRLLVTHGVSFLAEADLIVVMKQGRISECGTYKQLIANKGDFADFLLQYLEDAQDSDEDNGMGEMREELMKDASLRDRYIRAISARSEESIKLNRQLSAKSNTSSETALNESKTSLNNEKMDVKNHRKLMTVEESETGSVKLSVFFYYLKSIGLLMAATAVCSAVLCQMFLLSTNQMLSKFIHIFYILQVKLSVFFYYLKSIGFLMAATAVCGAVFCQMFLVSTNLMLSKFIHIFYILQVKLSVFFYYLKSIGLLMDATAVCSAVLCQMFLLSTNLMLSKFIHIFYTPQVKLSVFFYYLKSIGLLMAATAVCSAVLCQMFLLSTNLMLSKFIHIFYILQVKLSEAQCVFLLPEVYWIIDGCHSCMWCSPLPDVIISTNLMLSKFIQVKLSVFFYYLKSIGVLKAATAVKLSVFFYYLKSIGLLMAATAVCGAVLCQMFLLSTNLMLSKFIHIFYILQVKLSVFFYYLKSIGLLMAATAVCGAVLCQMFLLSTNLMLSKFIHIFYILQVKLSEFVYYLKSIGLLMAATAVCGAVLCQMFLVSTNLMLSKFIHLFYTLQVKLSVFFYYLKSIGLLMAATAVCAAVLCQMFLLSTNLMLSKFIHIFYILQVKLSVFFYYLKSIGLLMDATAVCGAVLCQMFLVSTNLMLSKFIHIFYILQVKLSVFFYYLKSIGLLMAATAVCGAVLCQMFLLSTNLMLSKFIHIFYTLQVKLSVFFYYLKSIGLLMAATAVCAAVLCQMFLLSTNLMQSKFIHIFYILQVKLSVFFYYLKSIGLLMAATAVCGAVLCQMFLLSTNLMLSKFIHIFYILQVKLSEFVYYLKSIGLLMAATAVCGAVLCQMFLVSTNLMLSKFIHIFYILQVKLSVFFYYLKSIGVLMDATAVCGAVLCQMFLLSTNLMLSKFIHIFYILQVKLSVFFYYLRSIGVLMAATAVCGAVLCQMFLVSTNLMLSKWSSDKSTTVNGTQVADKTHWYLGVYAALGIGQVVTSVMSNMCLLLGCVAASRFLHCSMLRRVLRAPMSFFDTTPLGRIINRFSRDIDICDTQLCYNLQQFLNFSVQTIAIIGVITYTTPPFILAIIPIFIINFYFQRLYVATSRQLKRLESTTRSPIYSHFGETIQGKLPNTVVHNDELDLPSDHMSKKYSFGKPFKVLIPDRKDWSGGKGPIPTGHSGIKGNEAADRLANTASATSLLGPQPFCGISRNSVCSAIASWAKEKHRKRWVDVPLLRRLYVATSRQLKRLESTTRSPIYSHFGETIQGAQSIRAYGLQEAFTLECERRIDFHQKCAYSGYIAQRWLSFRLEVVGNLIVLFAALFAVLSRGSLDSGMAGLSVMYALQVIITLNFFTRMTADVETNLVSVERIKEYSNVKQEAERIGDPGVEPSWPAKGRIEFQNYSVRYREGLDLVLKGVSFTVLPGEKVGIVGRTGAGKSSLTLALFRLLEAAEGAIIIDGRDIATVGLQQLRSKLTIIPQDPVLLSGTLRHNLDPFDEASDETLWKVLELSNLKPFVKTLPSGLHHHISESGDNLSVGQKQLVCLARALLRKTKVLVLDEATAAVDLETDNIIQQTIRREFKSCTVLTIAHRLQTIMDYDRILVMENGRVAEYENPKTLLQNSKSIFYHMVQDAGIVA